MSRKELLSKQRIKNKIRTKVFWTSERPRLSVFKSLSFLKVQLIDDSLWNTLYSAQVARNKKWASELGMKLAKESWVTNIVFDRNWYQYHWLVKLIAEEARKWGLIF